MTPYIVGGRPHRLPFVELFDVGNVDLDGSVFAMDNVRRDWNKVLTSSLIQKMNIPPMPNNAEIEPPTNQPSQLRRETPSSTSIQASTPVAQATLSFAHTNSLQKEQAATPNTSIHAPHLTNSPQISKRNSSLTTTSPHTHSGIRAKSPHPKPSRISTRTITHIADISWFRGTSLPVE